MFQDKDIYCRYISELESLEQEKLKQYSKDYSVTDSETLPTKLRNTLVKIVGKRPLINCYLNNANLKDFGIRDPW